MPKMAIDLSFGTDNERESKRREFHDDKVDRLPQ